ncbi:MAG: hypothetical protein OXH09_13650 [Gammaproteobacteria bacterium]|nr:hypothetical protein [Gammaproteobacteria bacterium]
MSEAEALDEQEATAEPPPPKFEKIFETRAPFDLADELQARVETNGVVDTIEELKENGCAAAGGVLRLPEHARRRVPPRHEDPHDHELVKILTSAPARQPGSATPQGRP